MSIRTSVTRMYSYCKQNLILNTAYSCTATSFYFLEYVHIVIILIVPLIQSPPPLHEVKIGLDRASRVFEDLDPNDFYSNK
jgi:hypothetical protein